MGVNEIRYNGKVLMSTRKDTVAEDTLVQGKTATSSKGEKITGNLDPVSQEELEELQKQVDTLSDEAYKISDEEGEITENDYIPFNDVSDEEQPKKKTLLSSLVNKLRSAFASVTGDNITKKDIFRENIQTLEWLGVDIPDNSDINTYKTAGNYIVVSDNSAETISNLPLSIGGKLIVFDNGNTGIEQFYLPNHSPRVFLRTIFGSESWSTWKELGEGGSGDDKPHTYEVGTPIPANTDIDTYMTEGVYDTAGNHSTISNLPVNGLGNSHEGKLIVSVVKKSDNTTSVYQCFTSGVITFSRVHNGSRWADWWQNALLENTYQLQDMNYMNHIKENDDLNDTKFVYNSGTFVCNSASIAQTLSHCPVTTPFKMMVDKSAGAVRQTITITGDIDELDESIWTRVWIEGVQVHRFSDWVNILAGGDSKAHTYEVGTSIPANSDLNTYVTEGVYKIAPNTTAETISNMPICDNGSIVGGKLVVNKGFSANETYVIQIYISNSEQIFKRSTINNGTTWIDWTQLASIQYDNGNRYLYLTGDTTTVGDKAVGIKTSVIDTTSEQRYTRPILRAFQDHQSTPTGLNLVMDSGGSLILGGGEAGYAHYGALTKPHTSEHIYLTSDGNIYLQANASTISNRLGFRVDVSGNLAPCKEDAIVDNQGKIGGASYKLQEIWTYKINNGDVVNSATLADTSLDKVQRLGGISERRIDIPDNSGYAKFLKFCDVTDWYNSTTTGQPVLLFVGWLVASREGGYATNSEIAEIELGVSYEKYTQVNNASLILSTSNDRYYPVILKEVLDGVTKYFLALRVRGSGRQGYLLGHFKMSDYSGNLFDGTWVNCTDSDETLPTGYSIEISGKTKQRESAYATCSTAGDQQVKVASIADPTWNLRVGVVVGVKFSNTNTYSSTTANPIKLNINNTGAKNIWYNNTHSGAGNTGTNTTIYGYASRVHYYMYDGTYWVWVGRSLDANDNNRKSFYGTCTTSADAQVKVVTLSDTNGWELRAGTIVGVKFSNTNTYSSTTSAPCQLNVNNTGAKNIWYWQTHSGAGNTGTNTTVYGVADRIHYYMYDGTYWVWAGMSGESDTVDPRALGSGYAICDTAEATTAKVATLSSYTLRTGGIVAVRFEYAVPANSTLNINSRGAKPIYQKTGAIPSSVIKGGDIATFVYDGTNYVLLGTDRTERQYANYRYANSAGTPDATYLTRNDTSVLFTELSYIRRGDTVMFGCVVRFASSKTYSASTKIATLGYSSLQICYPHASFYISGNGLYIRNATYNGYYYLQCTYIAS